VEGAHTAPLILETGASRAVFDRDGGRMTSLHFGGHELLQTEDGRGDVRFGVFITAIWAGLLREASFLTTMSTTTNPGNWDGLRLHGIARFAKLEMTTGSLVAARPSPWLFGSLITFTPRLRLEDLQVRFTVTAGESAMPAAVGWNPWFARSLSGVEASVMRPDDPARLECDDAGLPTGRWTVPGDRPCDDCSRTEAPAVVPWPGIGTYTVACGDGYVGVFDGEASGISAKPITTPVQTPQQLLQPRKPLFFDVTPRRSTS
jgi:aldose 1-epimerase